MGKEKGWKELSRVTNRNLFDSYRELLPYSDVTVPGSDLMGPSIGGIRVARNVVKVQPARFLINCAVVSQATSKQNIKTFFTQQVFFSILFIEFRRLMLTLQNELSKCYIDRMTFVPL